MPEDESLISDHGGYRRLKSFQMAQLVFDVTVRFCECYVQRRSRTWDQMIQAARSGVQNIAEGSQASGTSRKTEMKLTSVARASLEELRLDYEDFLRQRGLEQWEPKHPALLRFKAKRCATLEQVRAWVEEERKAARTDTDTHGPARTNTDSHGPNTQSASPGEQLKQPGTIGAQNSKSASPPESTSSVPVRVGLCPSVLVCVRPCLSV